VKNRFQNLPFKFNLQRYSTGQSQARQVLDRGELARLVRQLLPPEVGAVTSSIPGLGFRV
jgi:hypothetical protein